MVQAIGHRLIRPEDTEVAVFLVELENVTDIASKLNHILCLGAPWLHFNAIFAEVGQAQVLQQQAAVGMRVVAHACGSLRRKLLQFWNQASVVIKKFLRAVAFQPFLQLVKMLRLLHRHRNLMGAEGAFNLLSVYELRPCPPLWRT